MKHGSGFLVIGVTALQNKSIKTRDGHDPIAQGHEETQWISGVGIEVPPASIISTLKDIRTFCACGKQSMSIPTVRDVTDSACG